MPWTREEKYFASILIWRQNHSKLSLKTGESVIATHTAFYDHFMLCRNDGIPDRKSILVWVENFRTTGSLI